MCTSISQPGDDLGGFLVPAKLLKFGSTYLFQRKCISCGEKYLFHISETKTDKCFVCEMCSTEHIKIPKDAEKLDYGYGVKITSWSNRIAMVYEKQRRSRKNYARVFKRDKFICQYCFKTGDTIDHIVPISYGGTNAENNLVCACKTCNSKASNFVFNSFFSKKAYLNRLYKN